LSFEPSVVHAYADLASGPAHPYLAAILPNAVKAIDPARIPEDQRASLLRELKPYVRTDKLQRFSRLIQSGRWGDAATSIPWNRVPHSYLKMISPEVAGAVELLSSHSTFQQPAMSGDVFTAMHSAPWQRFHEAITAGIAEAEPSIIALVSQAQRIGAAMHPSGQQLDPEVLQNDAASYVKASGEALALRLTEDSRHGLKSLLISLSPSSVPFTEDDYVRARELIASRGPHKLLGITKRQAQVLSAKVKQWSEGEDLQDAAIHRLTDSEHGRLIAQRSETLRRTQASTAWNAGLLLAWKRLAMQSPDVPIIGLDSSFMNADGEIMRGPGIRPNCRCSQRLVLRALSSGQAVYVREWVTRDSGVSKKCASFNGALSMDAHSRFYS
jgi:hypothetical protein